MEQEQLNRIEADLRTSKNNIAALSILLVGISVASLVASVLFVVIFVIFAVTEGVANFEIPAGVAVIVLLVGQIYAVLAAARRVTVPSV